MLKHLLIATVLVIHVSLVHAQIVAPRYEAGFRLSGYMYQGDLSPAAVGSYKNPTLGIGLFATRILNRSFSVRANLDFTHLKDADARYNNPSWKQLRNLNFNTRVTDFSAHLVYNLKSNYSLPRFAPYVFGGVGISLLKVNRDASGFQNDITVWQDWVAPGLAADLATHPPRTIVTLPFGAGARHPLNDNWILFGEASYRFMFTDYLDGFSKVADRKWNDHYANLSVGILYRFSNNSIHCPSY